MTTAGYAYFQTKERHKALDKHGGNVVEFASRVTAISSNTEEQAPVPSANLPLSRSTLCTFTREALYNLVWSKPASSLAKQFGISDVGLAKAYKRARIPLPMRGYWAKIAVGQQLEKTALSPPESGKSDRIVLRARPTVEQ
jgi:hypothetical protein